MGAVYGAMSFVCFCAMALHMWCAYGWIASPTDDKPGWATTQGLMALIWLLMMTRLQGA